jgi:hypothetical protein
MNIKQRLYSKLLTVKAEPELLKKFREIVGDKNVSTTIRDFMKKTVFQEKKERFME